MPLQISLRAARVNAGKTQSEAAEHLKVSKTTVLNWENGNTQIPADKFRSLCAFYGMPDSHIFLPTQST